MPAGTKAWPRGRPPELGLACATVRRYARAATWQDMLHGQWQNLPSTLDPHRAYLIRRWSEGCSNAAALHRELLTRGYRGGCGQVCHFVQ